MLLFCCSEYLAIFVQDQLAFQSLSYNDVFLVQGMVMQVKLFRDEQTKQLYSIIGYEDGTVALWDLGTCAIKNKVKTHTEAGMEHL